MLRLQHTRQNSEFIFGILMGSSKWLESKTISEQRFSGMTISSPTIIKMVTGNDVINQRMKRFFSLYLQPVIL